MFDTRGNLNAARVLQETPPGQGPVKATTRVGQVRVIALSGRLSAVHTTTVGAAIAVAAQHGAVVVDLSEVELIDASIARTLRISITSHIGTGDTVGAAGATGQPLEVLEVLGIAKEIGAYRELSEAIDAAHGGTVDPNASLEVSVQSLLAAAHALPRGDRRRVRLEHDAIEATLPLARTIAYRFYGRGEPMDDLLQVASLAVVRAVRAYNPDHGSGFRAYAVPTIIGELKRYLRDHARVVRSPRRLQELQSEIAFTAPRMAQEFGREPTSDELARRLDVAVEDVARAAVSRAWPASLDAPMGSAPGWTLYDLIGTDDQGLHLAECRSVLKQAMTSLPASARHLLALRFGQELSQSEIAARLGTSQMTVSRQLMCVLGKLRAALLAED